MVLKTKKKVAAPFRTSTLPKVGQFFTHEKINKSQKLKKITSIECKNVRQKCIEKKLKFRE